MPFAALRSWDRLFRHQAIAAEKVTQWGALGVYLFFVLSGFLITEILLKAGDDARLTDYSPLKVTGRFAVRRALRIFPLFYVVLASSSLLGVADVLATWPWHVGYASNLLVVHRDLGLAR